MDSSSQDLSALLGNLIQGPATSTVPPGHAQPVGAEGENAGGEFLASLEASLDELAQGAPQSPALPDAEQPQTTFGESLEGQLQVEGGNGLPLDGLFAVGEEQELTTPEGVGVQTLMSQLQQSAVVPGELDDSSLPAAQPAQEGEQSTPVAPQPWLDHMEMVVLPATANEAAQAQVGLRRLFERFQSLPEMQQMAPDLPANMLRQALGLQGKLLSSHSTVISADAQNSSSWLGEMNADLALTPTSEGDDFDLQMLRMAELKDGAMSPKGAAALESLAKGDLPDVTSLNSAAQPRPTTPAALSDARPTQSFVHVPLHDPQWQNEFNNRVTWLARAGGNQTAEIRLNPANMGPIEVRVVMNDDQATITFTAQHGAVRDAIEASLPRLREMFMGSGLQLAQANVSDQPLHEQRQQQGFGSGNGHAKGGQYEQVESIADLVSPVSLSMSHAPVYAGRLDLYA